MSTKKASLDPETTPDEFATVTLPDGTQLGDGSSLVQLEATPARVVRSPWYPHNEVEVGSTEHSNLAQLGASFPPAYDATPVAVETEEKD